MGDVINLEDHKPHVGGEAVCLQCSHTWVAVARVGTLALDCPECETQKGVFVGLAVPETFLKCGCGNALYYITPTGYQCAKCGESPGAA